MSLTFLKNNIVSGQIRNMGVSEQLAGYRTLYPDAMMCPMWTGTDLAGRPVCENSFYTKRAGCNSALDRIKVEDSLRPRYAEFLLDARGIEGAGADYGDNQFSSVVSIENALVKNRRDLIGVQNGNFGVVTPSQYQIGLSGPYNEMASNGFQNVAQVMSADQMAQSAQNRRNAQNLAIGGTLPRPNGFNPVTPAVLPGQKGFGPAPTPAVLPGQKGYGPAPTPAIIPHSKGYTPADKCNPNTTVCTGLWRNDMFVPRQPTTYQNYIQARDYNHHHTPPEYI